MNYSNGIVCYVHISIYTYWFFLTVIFFRSDIRYYMQYVVVKPRKYSLLLMIGRMMHSTSCTLLDFSRISYQFRNRKTSGSQNETSKEECTGAWPEKPRLHSQPYYFRAARPNFWQARPPQWQPHQRGVATAAVAFNSAKSRQCLGLGALPAMAAPVLDYFLTFKTSYTSK